MKKRVVFSFLWLLVMASGFAQTKVQNTLTEHLTNPIGVESTQPRFNWQLLSDKRNVLQTSYELRVGSNPSFLASNKDLVWSSGSVSSDSSINVTYKGRPLTSGQRGATSKDIQTGSVDNGYVPVKVGSGKYSFSTNWNSHGQKKEK